MLINPLIIVRDIHFASSVILAGIAFFDWLIASLVLRRHFRTQAAERCFRDRIGRVFWICLALSFLSALAWLCLLSARIAGKAFAAVISDGTVWKVLSNTQFGHAWQARLILCVLLALGSSPWPKASETSIGIWRKALAAVLAGAYLGTLAFAGHGEEGLGFDQSIHLTADFLHLVAAGLWLGGLVPLALLLIYLRQFREADWLLASVEAASRFSTLGILAVGILLVSGTVNASFLLSGMNNLIDTAYGRWLLLKIMLAIAMIVLAGINREYLLPRLFDDIGGNPAPRALQGLLRNTMIEIALGLGVISIVGMLGIMEPATVLHSHVH
jgi:copper resistance protein D